MQGWPAHRWQNGVPADAILDPAETARWLLVEWRRDGTIKYALSNLPPEITLGQAVRWWKELWWKERWQVEHDYEQLKGELGLDHFEGRTWTGFHHHATMTFLAYGFLALERQRVRDAVAADGAELPPGELHAARDPAGRAPRPPAVPRPTLSPLLPRLPPLSQRLHLTEQTYDAPGANSERRSEASARGRAMLMSLNRA